LSFLGLDSGVVFVGNVQLLSSEALVLRARVEVGQPRRVRSDPLVEFVGEALVLSSSVALAAVLLVDSEADEELLDLSVLGGEGRALLENSGLVPGVVLEAVDQNSRLERVPPFVLFLRPRVVRCNFDREAVYESVVLRVVFSEFQEEFVLGDALHACFGPAGAVEVLLLHEGVEQRALLDVQLPGRPVSV